MPTAAQSKQSMHFMSFETCCLSLSHSPSLSVFGPLNLLPMQNSGPWRPQETKLSGAPWSYKGERSVGNIQNKSRDQHGTWRDTMCHHLTMRHDSFTTGSHDIHVKHNNISWSSWEEKPTPRKPSCTMFEFAEVWIQRSNWLPMLDPIGRFSCEVNPKVFKIWVWTTYISDRLEVHTGEPVQDHAAMHLSFQTFYKGHVNPYTLQRPIAFGGLICEIHGSSATSTWWARAIHDDLESGL